jgi:hypothetical protein
MSQFKFLIPDVKEVPAEEWLRTWAERYPEDYSEEIYRELIAKHESLSTADFVRIGKWKDNAWSERRWRANVASVAFQIWMKAASDLPKCPSDGEVEGFLSNWSGMVYTDLYKNGSREKRFGLSRATTLLHFVSGGRFPIFDSRVRTAMARLLDPLAPQDTVCWYLDSYCPLFSEVAVLCGADEMRIVDKALFSYGASEDLTSSG